MRPDTPSGRLLQAERLNQEPILVEIVRPSIWQLRGSPGTQGLNIGAVCGNRTHDHGFRGSVLVLRPKDKCRRMVWSWRNWNGVMPKVHRVRLVLGIIRISPSPPSLFPMATPAFRLLFLMGTNYLPRNLTFLGLPALTMNAGPINFPTSFHF